MKNIAKFITCASATLLISLALADSAFAKSLHFQQADRGVIRVIERPTRGLDPAYRFQQLELGATGWTWATLFEHPASTDGLRGITGAHKLSVDRLLVVDKGPNGQFSRATLFTTNGSVLDSIQIPSTLAIEAGHVQPEMPAPTLLTSSKGDLFAEIILQTPLLESALLHFSIAADKIQVSQSTWQNVTRAITDRIPFQSNKKIIPVGLGNDLVITSLYDVGWPDPIEAKTNLPGKLALDLVQPFTQAFQNSSPELRAYSVTTGQVVVGLSNVDLDKWAQGIDYSVAHLMPIQRTIGGVTETVLTVEVKVLRKFSDQDLRATGRHSLLGLPNGDVMLGFEIDTEANAPRVFSAAKDLKPTNWKPTVSWPSFTKEI